MCDGPVCVCDAVSCVTLSRVWRTGVCVTPLCSGLTSDSGKTVEEIAAAISRRSRAGTGRRPPAAPMALQKSSTEPAVPTGGDVTPPEIRRTGGIRDRSVTATGTGQ